MTDVDLSAKTVLVTGANVGIGYETALALARRLAAGPPLALRAMKEGIRRGLESSLADEWEHNIYVQSLLIDSKDYAEGIAALREGRTPQFKGR